MAGGVVLRCGSCVCIVVAVLIDVVVVDTVVIAVVVVVVVVAAAVVAVSIAVLNGVVAVVAFGAACRERNTTRDARQKQTTTTTSPLRTQVRPQWKPQIQQQR